MVPFLDLKAQYRTIKPEIDEAVARVLENASYILGPEVQAFERDFAAACSVSHAVGTNSGTSALHLALLAAGVGPGDEVVTTPFTFVATVAAITYAGATPVLVDIDPVSYTIDPALIEDAITPKTKAIIPVHLYGQPADMDPILDIARRHGLAVIEDACQAHLAEYKGRRAGSMGEYGCFSFYPGKNLGAYGEGGAAVTSLDGGDRTLRMLRDWGAERRYHHELRGFNYRMEGIQGAVLGVKLKYLPAWTEARRSAAATYGQLLSTVGVPTPVELEYSKHVYHVYAVRVPERERVQRELSDRGVQTNIHYPFPVHLLEAYRDLGYAGGAFPASERAAAEVLSLPLFPEITREQIEEVVSHLAAVL